MSVRQQNTLRDGILFEEKIKSWPHIFCLQSLLMKMMCAEFYSDFLMCPSCPEYSLCAFEVDRAAGFYLFFLISKALSSVSDS